MIRAARQVGRHGVRDAAIILLMFRITGAELQNFKDLRNHTPIVTGVGGAHNGMDSLAVSQTRKFVLFHQVFQGLLAHNWVENLLDNSLWVLNGGFGKTE